MIWALIIYLLIGAVWAVYAILKIVKDNEIPKHSPGMILLGFVFNVIFWPLIMILAYAVGKFFSRMGDF